MWSTLFPKNESSFDRIVRIGLGLGLLSLVSTGPRTALGYVGVLPLATGLLGSCPLYSVLGMSTGRARGA